MSTAPTGSAPAPDRIRDWHPGWLGVALGTAGVAVASLVDPVPDTGLDEAVGSALTLLAAVLLVVLVVPYLLRWRRHRDALLADLAHPGLGAMFGTLPASLLILGVALGQLAVLGHLPAGSAYVVLVLVLLGAGAALAVGVEFFSRLARADQVPPQAMTGAWFIPIVVLVLVPSAAARLVVLQPDWLSSTAVALSAALWGAGILLFLLLAPILGWRLLTAPGVPAAQAATWWIWLAPTGAGGLGALALGRITGRLLGGAAVVVLPAAGLLVATVLWGLGTWWALLAARVLRADLREHGRLPFHLGSWGFAFPTAAMAALTVELGRGWGSDLLSVAGGIGWAAAVLVWARLAWQSARAVRDGSLFVR